MHKGVSGLSSLHLSMLLCIVIIFTGTGPHKYYRLVLELAKMKIANNGKGSGKVFHSHLKMGADQEVQLATMHLINNNSPQSSEPRGRALTSDGGNFGFIWGESKSPEGTKLHIGHCVLHQPSSSDHLS